MCFYACLSVVSGALLVDDCLKAQVKRSYIRATLSVHIAQTVQGD